MPTINIALTITCFLLALWYINQTNVSIRTDYTNDIDNIASVMQKDIDQQLTEIKWDVEFNANMIRTDREKFETRFNTVEEYAFSWLIDEARRILRESGYDPLYINYISSNPRSVSFSYNEFPDCGGCIQFLEVIPAEKILIKK